MSSDNDDREGQAPDLPAGAFGTGLLRGARDALAGRRRQVNEVVDRASRGEKGSGKSRRK